MQIARDIAGFSMGASRRAAQGDGQEAERQDPGLPREFSPVRSTTASTRELAEDIFAFVEPFAGYGFNKSHAAAYGWIAYQTAFLKANHPLQYLTALMTSVKDKTDKLVEYIDEAKKIGIAVLPPDVNESLVDFAVVGDQIRFGLAAVKGVGEGAVRAHDRRARQRRPLRRSLRSRQARRRQARQSARLRGARQVRRVRRAARATAPQLLDAIDAALDVAARATRERELGQVSLFGEPRKRDRRSRRSCATLPPPTTHGVARVGEGDARHLRLGPSACRRADALARSGAIADQGSARASRTTRGHGRRAC